MEDRDIERGFEEFKDFKRDFERKIDDLKKDISKLGDTSGEIKRNIEGLTSQDKTSASKSGELDDRIKKLEAKMEGVRSLVTDFGRAIDQNKTKLS